MTNALTLNFSSFIERTDNITLNAAIINDFLKNYDCSDKTKETYKRGINAFISWLNENEIESVEQQTITQFKLWCKGNKSANTTNTYLTSIKALYNYLETKGFRNYAKSVKKAKTDKEHFTKDSLTREQVQTILASIDCGTLTGAREFAMFTLLINTGLRECELVGADINDIGSKDNKSVLYIKGKGRTQKNDFVVLNNSCIQALTAYFAIRGAAANEPLFTSCSDRNNGQRLTTRSVRNIVKGLYKRNGLITDRLTTHSTRHTFVTFTLKSGASLQEAQQRARHKDINTTLIYAHNLKLTESNAEQLLDNYINGGLLNER